MKHTLLLTLIFLGCSFAADAQPISINVTPITSPSVPRYAKFETGISLSLTTFNNQFNPNEIDVYAIFTHIATGQTERVDAFWYQDFDMNESSPDPTVNPSDTCVKKPVDVSDPAFLVATNTPLPWRVRFCPSLDGNWYYQVFVKHMSSTTIYNSSINYLSVTPSNLDGYISVNPSNQHNFMFTETKKPFVPLGVNAMNNGSIVFNRASYLSTKEVSEKLASVNGNTIRIFMSPEHFGIEWNEDGVGKYLSRQNRAYTLDQIFQLAENHGLKIQLVLESNHAFHNFDNGDPILNGYNLWVHNPYRTVLGPTTPVLNNQYNFFTNQQCIDLFKQKLRYIIARWGYSPCLLAYEFWNEVGIMEKALPTIWDNNNMQHVQDWHTLMVSFVKERDKKHMFTSSPGGPGFFNPATNALDFVQDHYYANTMNILYNYSVFAQFSTKTYGKPYITGEIGALKSWYGDTSFTRTSFSAGNYAHDMIDFHNAIWATLFNGSAGPAYSWVSRDLFNKCWGGAYKNFQPMSLFLDGDDFFSKKLTYLSNIPTGPAGSKDFPSYSHGNNSVPVWPYWPLPNSGIPPVLPPSPLSDFITSGITTSDNSALDIFAAKSEDGKIYGWVHNRKSYWYEMPHKAGGDVAALYNFNDNQPVDESNIPVLRGEKFTISGLECDGMYEIKYFSAYSQYDLNGDGNAENGGIITPFTQTFHAYCGTLTINLPTLSPLSIGGGPYAPDYAFKISKVQDDWSHSIVTGGLNYSSCLGSYNSSNVFYSDINGALRKTSLNTSTNTSQQQLISPPNPNNNEKIYGPMCVNAGSQVFYKGADSRLQCYYPSGTGSWNHIWLTDWSNNSQNVGSYMAYGPYNVFYQGIDQRLHRYFFNQNTNQWEHSILPNNNDPNSNVLGAITVDQTNNHVFYVGSDHRLQGYYLANGIYTHIWLTNWSNTSQNVVGDIKVVGTEIYYAGEDGKLHKYYFSNNTWTHTLLFDQSGQSIPISHLTNIAIIGNGDQIFFTGANGQMERLYNKQNNTYTHDFAICPDDFDPITEWSSGTIVCDNQESVYYVGHSDLHLYAFDNSCTPRGRAGKRPSGNRSDVKVPVQISVAETQAANTENLSSLYPNPFKDKLNILIAKGGSIQVSIENSLGQQVYFSTYICNDDQTLTINTAELPQGIYFVTILTDGTIVKKSKVLKM